MNAIRWVCGGVMIAIALLAWHLNIALSHPHWTEFCFGLYVLTDAATKSMEGA